MAGARDIRELLPETPPNVVGDGILGDAMLYLTPSALEDGMLFLNPDDLRKLLKPAIEQEETAAIVREIAGDGDNSRHCPRNWRRAFSRQNNAKSCCCRPALLPSAPPVATAHVGWT